MSRVCTICRHSERQAIDAALVLGSSYRNIAQRFAVSVAALHRHKKHLSEHLLAAREAEEVLSASKLLADLRALQARALTLLDKAEGVYDIRAALGAIREARQCVESCASLLEVSAVSELTEQLRKAGIKT